jgi:hypothetical protein
MNLPDQQIKNYLQWMLRDFEQIQSSSRNAVLISIRTYAVGLIRVIDFCLGRAVSLNIDALQENEREISRSFQAQKTNEREIIHAQKPEITALDGFCRCGNSLEGLRKGTRFCSKKCNNLSRNK